MHHLLGRAATVGHGDGGQDDPPEIHNKCSRKAASNILSKLHTGTLQPQNIAAW